MQDLEKALEQLKKEIAREEEYCIPDAKKSENLKPLLKNLYDEASAATEKTFGPLKSLIVAGVDEESIWEELQTRSKPLAKFIERKTRVLGLKIDRKLQVLEKKKQKQQELELNGHSDDTDGDDSDVVRGNPDLYDSEEEEEDEEPFFDGEEEEAEEASGDEQDEDDMEEESEDAEEGEEDAAEVDEENLPKKKKSKSTADDMKDEMEMEAWLDAFEEMEYKHREKLENRERRAKASTVESKEWDDEHDEEEDDLDFVEKAMYDSDEDDEDEEDFDPRSIKYSDFFVDDSKDKSKGKAAKKSNKRVAEEDDEDDDMDFEGHDDFEESDGGEGDYDMEDDEEEEEEEEEESEEEQQPASSGNKDEAKSTFLTSYQRRKKELANQISELEKELIAEKAWELRGEVKATTRPENSLLDLAVDIERSTKATPIITQEYTTTLEDIIMARIKDSRFNDPNPRNGSVDMSLIDPSAQGEGQDLSQEKSKVGLGELYAEEYAKKINSQEETLDVQTQAAREEVINLYNAVARELDALSHFFYSPKPVAAEASAKVLATQRAMPALEMEDIAPFTQNSSATAAAPEQMLEHKRGKKVTLLSSAELTREDRKKLRRHNKEVKKVERAEQEKDTSIKNVRKQANKKLEEELRADKRVVISDSANKSKKHEDTNQFSKSSAFFSKLQEDTQKQIKNTVKVGDKRRREGAEDQRPAAAFKL